jgi:hypothetical protein
LFIKKADPDFYIPPNADIEVRKGLEVAKQLLAWRHLYGDRITQWLVDNVDKMEV